MQGRPIPIVVPSDEEGTHTFHLDKEALEGVLSKDKTKDKHIVVVSIAGAFRKGKSFLLDFLLRYLCAQVRYVGVGVASVYKIILKYNCSPCTLTSSP